MSIDLHSHVLPSLDDGAESLEVAVAICEAAVVDGTTIIAATPHVRWDYPTTPAKMKQTLGRVRRAVKTLPIEILPGGEIALEQLELPIDTLREFALAGNPDYLLVETPYFDWPSSLVPQLARLTALGITPVLAHPERNRIAQRTPRLVFEAVEAGALVQLTAASLDGRTGRSAESAAKKLLQNELAHLVASDAHHPDVRAVGLSSVAAVVGEELGTWLTHAVPLAIVRGTPLPPRPGRSRKSALSRLLGGPEA
ncbi:MAG TPA: CpsB/CapC family capsule biosynthesis tyrosine phosphatase [Gaiellaceae bacterium]|nr:CpsB/CapC family capsule biosynthesis tyrosine phosphatase [Gaiellaceae bacterium]